MNNDVLAREYLLKEVVDALPYLTGRECMITSNLLEYFKSVGLVEGVEE
jgi:hypothetical protein